VPIAPAKATRPRAVDLRIKEDVFMVGGVVCLVLWVLFFAGASPGLGGRLSGLHNVAGELFRAKIRRGCERQRGWSASRAFLFHHELQLFFSPSFP
jgi:hypothetical protein